MRLNFFGNSMRNRFRIYKGIGAGLVSPLVLLVISPLVARLLGPEGRGQMAYVLTVLVLLDYIALGGAINYLMVEAKSKVEFSEKLIAIKHHINKTTWIASILSVILATKYLSNGVESFVFMVILLNSFRVAKSIELKKVSAVINGDWKTLNRERVLIPIVRLLLTCGAFFLHVTNPLVFVSLQVLAGAMVSLYCFRRYSIPKNTDPVKAKGTPSSVNKFYIWSIFENAGYWGVNFLIGVLISSYEFGILAIALVTGEIILTVEKFMIKYQTTLHIEVISTNNTLVREKKPFNYSLSFLLVVTYALVVYFSIPLVFGNAYSDSVFPSLICICASYLRLILRLQNYKVAQLGRKYPAVIAESSMVVSGILLCAFLPLFPSAIVGSTIIFASVLFGLIVSFVNNRRFL